MIAQIDNLKFIRWKRAVEESLRRDWSVDFELAGFAEEDIKSFYDPRQSAKEFVQWFAQKYDLHNFNMM